MLETIREKVAHFIAPEIVERRNHFERLAMTDALTGLGNRAAFDRAAPGAVQNGEMFILFDANNFGKINKQVSHARGDEALVYFANVIANVSHNFKARAFRYGSGDEFVVICPARFACCIRDLIETRALPISFDGFTVSLSGEVGTSVTDADARLQARKTERKTR